MSMRPRLLSLCTGTGALDMAVGAFYGADVVGVAETDPGACKLLELRALGVPNLGDITQLDWATVPECDILTAGFPCQPVSHAGKRKGMADERWIWESIAEGLRQLRPDVAVFENVRGLLTANGGHAFARVLHDIHSVGIYECRWGAVRAADAGAAHRRERIFILCVAANTDGTGGEAWDDPRRASPVEDGVEPVGHPPPAANTAGVGRGEGARQLAPPRRRAAAERAAGNGESGGRPEDATDSPSVGLSKRARPGESQPSRQRGDGSGDDGDTAATDATGAERGAQKHEAVGAAIGSAAELGERHSEAAADPDGAGLERHGESEKNCAERRQSSPEGYSTSCDWGPYDGAVRRWESILGRRAPDPTDERGLNPWFVEWMMGFETGFVCDANLSRTNELRLLGNSVVAQQALLALELLHE